MSHSRVWAITFWNSFGIVVIPKNPAMERYFLVANLKRKCSVVSWFNGVWAKADSISSDVNQASSSILSSCSATKLVRCSILGVWYMTLRTAMFNSLAPNGIFTLLSILTVMTLGWIRIISTSIRTFAKCCSSVRLLISLWTDYRSWNGDCRLFCWMIFVSGLTSFFILWSFAFFSAWTSGISINYFASIILINFAGKRLTH